VAALTLRFPELNVIVTYREASEVDVAVAHHAGVASLVPESDGLAAVLALLWRGRDRQGKNSLGKLTGRELELTVLTVAGHSTADIADLLGLSPLTVENLKRRVYAKLDVSSSVHVVAKAASLGMLDPRTDRLRPIRPPGERQRQADGESVVLPVVTGQHGPAMNQVVCALVSNLLPFVLIRKAEPVSGAHRARWHRGLIVAVLVDPAQPDWELVGELGVPAIVVHSKPLDPPALVEALACGASALISAERIDDRFLSALHMVGQGYPVVDTVPMRPLIGAVRARWDEPGRNGLELPELTARESDVVRLTAQGCSIRQTARILGITPRRSRTFRRDCSASSACETGPARWPWRKRSICCRRRREFPNSRRKSTLARRAPELAQAELAAVLGVSRARISTIEHGEISGAGLVRRMSPLSAEALVWSPGSAAFARSIGGGRPCFQSVISLRALSS